MKATIFPFILKMYDLSSINYKKFSMLILVCNSLQNLHL